MTSDLRRRVPDLLLAAAAIVLILLEIWFLDEPAARLTRSVPGIVAGASLAFLRTKPFVAFLVNGVAIMVLISLGHPSGFYQWTNLIAVLGASSRLDLGRATAILAFGVSGVVYYFLRFPNEAPPSLAVAVLAIWLAAWFGGRVQFARSQEAELKRDRDLTRAQLTAQRAELALEEERGRIARELHDIIGHSVNVMVLHAGGGRGAVETDPAAAVHSFETIAAIGREALADLDRMLDVLNGRVEYHPLPGVGHLDDLCRSVAETGLSVDLSITGDQATVDPSVGVTVYRIVQEALTNVMKHANAQRAGVDVTIGDILMVTVTDDGIGSTGPAGRGLRGIAERAALHGGTVIYGEVPGGGFQLRCRLSRQAQPLSALPWPTTTPWSEKVCG